MPYPDNIGLDHRIVVLTIPIDFTRLSEVMPTWLKDEINDLDIPILDGYIFSVDGQFEITHSLNNGTGGLDERLGVAAEPFGPGKADKCPLPYLGFPLKTFIRSSTGSEVEAIMRLIYGPYRIPG